MIDRESDRLSEVPCLQILRVLKSEYVVHSVFFGSPSRKAELLIRRPPKSIGEINSLLQLTW